MSESATARQISTTPRSLRVEWDDGRVGEFPSIWLRDNRPGDRDAHSGQRLIDITDLPPDARIRSAGLHADTVLVEWETEPQPTSFDLAWLARQAAGGAPLGRPELQTRLWLEGSSVDAEADFGWAALEDLGSAKARLAWLTRLLQDGIAFIRGVPSRPEAILEAVALMGDVAETNYGRVFDVRSVPQPENLAYSDLGLGLHTDNPYREPVPGFQALHVLAASPDGGDSLFADGFALAEHLRAQAPEAFRDLTQTAVPFLYRSGEADLYAERPLIQLSCEGAVMAVHYNSRSISPLRLAPGRIESFYASYRAFAQLLREPRFQVRYRLPEGVLVAFDNHRVLHGRTAFSSARHLRHLRGCYLTRDSVYSRTAVLRRKLAAEGVS